MTVNLEISNSLFRSYLPKLCQLSEGNIHRISRNNNFGKYVCCLVAYGKKKQEYNIKENTVTFRLPKSDSLSTAQNRFLYFTKESQLKIEDMIKVCFDLDMDRYYLEGKRQGFKDKQIIEAFIVERGLTEELVDNERIKKRIYRQSLKELELLTAKLVSAARYRNRSIEANISEHLVYSKTA